MSLTISVICPSRGRPQRWAAMVDSALETAIRPSRVLFNVLVDRDDPCLAEYVNLSRAGVGLVVNDRPRPAPALYNELALGAAGEILIAASDDVLFRTPCWDDRLERIFAGFPDRLLVAYFGDGPSVKFPGGRDKVEHFATSREFVESVGYFMRDDYEHFCADQHTGEIARLAGRLRAAPEIVLEHLHAKYGRAENDETYRAKRAGSPLGPMHVRDEARYRGLAQERHDAAVRVVIAMRKRPTLATVCRAIDQVDARVG